MSDIDHSATVSAIAAKCGCITEAEFVEFCAILPSTAEAWRKRNIGPSWSRVGNRVLYSLSDVAEWVASKKKTLVEKSAAGNFI